MAAKATWKGNIKLGFVIQPVGIYGAKESKTPASGVSFNQLHTCGARTTSPCHCPKCNVDVDRADIVKGYEFAKGQYVTVTADELKACEVETTKVIDLKEFVPLAELNPTYIAATHFVAPDNPALADAFALIRDALDGYAGIGTLAIGGRELMVAIVAHGRGLMMHTLRQADEVRDIADVDVLAKVPTKTDPATVAMMRQLIDAKKVDTLDLSKYPDAYRANVKALLARKVAGEEPSTPATPKAEPKAVDLMEQLRASLSMVQTKEGAIA